MAFILNDRVKVTSTTQGTGVFALGSAATGFETFATGIGGSNTTYYAIAHQSSAEFEVGFGTLDSDGDALTRTYIINSSNSDAAVDFSAGTKDVFCTMPASKVGLPFPQEYGSSSAPKIITVKVGNKTSNHPYPAGGSSSSNAYFFDGLEAPALRFAGVDPNAKYYYKFDTSHAVNVCNSINGDLTLNSKLKMPDNTSGKILVGDGTSYEEVAVSGDATLSSSGALTITGGVTQGFVIAMSVAL